MFCLLPTKYQFNFAYMDTYQTLINTTLCHCSYLNFKNKGWCLTVFFSFLFEILPRTHIGLNLMRQKPRNVVFANVPSYYWVLSSLTSMILAEGSIVVVVAFFLKCCPFRSEFGRISPVSVKLTREIPDVEEYVVL